MTARNLFLSLVGAFCILIPNLSSAAASLTILDQASPFNSVSINQGGNFTVDINVSTTTEQISGFSYLLTISALGSGSFSLTSRDIAGAPYTASDFTFNNASVFSGSNATLDPTNNNDLGATLASPLAAGSYFLARFVISSLPSVPLGAYTVSFNAASVFDQDFNEITPLTTGTYTVNVVPEPKTWFMLALGLTVIVLFRRRQTT